MKDKTDEKKKDKTDEKKKDKTSRDERGGITQGRQSWAGKTIDCLLPVGTEKQGLWFTHKAIKDRLKNRGYGVPENLGQVLYGLVKSGHLERSMKPNHMKGKQVYRNEFIYRRTGKPYREKKSMGKVALGNQIRLDHPRLAKWFRDMMIY